MGIHLNLIHLLADTVRRYGLAGRICTLGAQELTAAADDTAAVAAVAGLTNQMLGSDGDPVTRLFLGLGFSGLETLDERNVEGCTYVTDLNAEQLPPGL